MATIHSLPPESIGCIISTAYSSATKDYDELLARSQFLLATSLVCRDWTPFAQRELWTNVRLVDASSVRLFVRAGVNRYPVRRLFVNTGGLAFCRALEHLLRNVRDVLDLRIVDARLDIDWVSGDNFADLQSLDLVGGTLVARSAANLPVNITTLKIQFDELPPTEWMAAISRQASITSLSLSSSTGRTSSLDRLWALGTQLVTLDLALREESSTSVDDFLRRCTQLEHLTLNSLYIPSLHHLIASPISLTLAYFNDEEITPLLDVLKSQAVAVKGLERMTLRFEFNDEDVSSEVEKVCQDRSIQLYIEDEGY